MIVCVALRAAKARLARQGLTIPWLKLVIGHMVTNLIVNVKEALEGFPVGVMYCWLDSSVALHLINGAGSYKQFMSNRVQKTQQKNAKWAQGTTQLSSAAKSGNVEK